MGKKSLKGVDPASNNNPVSEEHDEMETGDPDME